MFLRYWVKRSAHRRKAAKHNALHINYCPFLKI